MTAPWTVCLQTWTLYQKVDPQNFLPNDAETLKRLGFGPSSLHARIRSMKFFLNLHLRMKTKNLADKIEIKSKMQDSKSIYQVIVDLFLIIKFNKKNKIKDELKILVDFVKTGFSTYISGNIAWIFFENYEKSAKILDLEKKLL